MISLNKIEFAIELGPISDKEFRPSGARRECERLQRDN